MTQTISIHEAVRRLEQALANGRSAEVVPLARALLAVQPGHADIRGALAGALIDTGDAAGALREAGAVLAAQPGHAAALRARALALQALGRLDEAAAAMDAAIAAAPGDVLLVGQRGVIHAGRRDLMSAVRDFRAVLERDAGSQVARSNLVQALQELHRHGEALEVADSALAREPRDAHFHSLRGASLQRLGRLAEARAAHEHALALDATRADHHERLMGTLMEQGDEPAIRAAADAALARWPDHRVSRFARACLSLRAGRYTEGWADYEHRPTQPDRSGPLAGRRRWTGPGDGARRVLLTAEQGLGDTLMFARFAQRLAERGVGVDLAPQPALSTLLQGLRGVRVLRDAMASDAEAALPLPSLPGRLGAVTAEALAAPPYLHPDPQRVARWAARLPAEGLRIGVAWRAARGNADVGRWFPPQALAPLAELPGVRLVSLQKPEPGDEPAPAAIGAVPLLDLGPMLDPGADAFVDTAAVIAGLDLVISCDTSIAHLAGALGAPVWVALKRVPEWRWGTGDTTPWYGSARLFRQSVHGEWAPVFEAMAQALRDGALGIIQSPWQRPT